MRSLLPPPSGLADFFATIHVKFPTPVVDPQFPDETPTQGYYQNFGVRAKPARVHLVLQDLISDGLIEWEDSEWELVDPNTFDKDFRDQIEPVVGEGVWYRGGQVFYADSDLEAKDQ